jgi:hypothetical protein
MYKKIAKYLFIGVVLALAMYLLLSYLLHDGAIDTSSTQYKEHPLKNEYRSNSYDEMLSQKSSVSGGIDSKLNGDSAELAKYKAQFSRAKDGVIIESVEDGNYSPQEKKEIEDSIENLKRYGSLSGGRMTTEFSNADYNRDTLSTIGIKDILAKVGFQPYDLTQAMSEKGLKLTGSSVGGANNGTGFDSFYRLYESKDGQKFEVGETKISPTETVVTLVKETLNANINGTPALVQHIDNNNVNSALFVTNGYQYSIASMGMDKNSMLNIASNIVTARSKK